MDRIEARSGSEDFWKDPEAAQKLLQRRKRLESDLDLLKRLQRQEDDARVLVEWLEGGEDVEKDVESGLDTLEQTLDGSGQYYESIDLIDAYHPQTILAYEMNDRVLPVAHGAPVRLRVERQLGYKHAKYVMRIAAVEDLGQIGRGNGGFWPDRGYEWYAGI